MCLSLPSYPLAFTMLWSNMRSVFSRFYIANIKVFFSVMKLYTIKWYTIQVSLLMAHLVSYTVLFPHLQPVSHDSPTYLTYLTILNLFLPLAQKVVFCLTWKQLDHPGLGDEWQIQGHKNGAAWHTSIKYTKRHCCSFTFFLSGLLQLDMTDTNYFKNQANRKHLDPNWILSTHTKEEHLKQILSNCLNPGYHSP